MSITDELRDWVANHYSGWTSKQAKGFAIADRIDAEYQKAEDEWKAKDGQTWVRGYAECHAELMEGNEVIAADLEKAGWVRWPLDADGKPIHIGDVMEVKFEPERKPFTVSFVGERSVAFWVDGQPDLKSINLDHVLVIHHKPTVKDVLREFANMAREHAWPDFNDLVDEYAEKLREVVEHDRD